MSRTSELIQQIIEVRGRGHSDATIGALFGRLFKLERAFETRGELHPELLKYFPVGLVACIEGSFRLYIKEIIDTGSPYLERAEKLLTSGKFDFESIKALHGKQITIGELISHQVSINNLTGVCSQMSELLGSNFLLSLRQVHDRWAYEIQKKPKEPILQDPDAIYAAVARTFELRHIICHELATGYDVKLEEVESCFFSTTLFLKASEALVSETLNPGAPLTHKDMHIAQSERLQGLLSKVESLNQQIAELVGQGRTEDFSNSVAAWQAYMKSWAEFEANEYKGGSILPTIYGAAASQVAQARVDQLIEYLDRIGICIFL